MRVVWRVSGVLLLLAALPAIAQPIAEPAEQVTVFAPYVVKKVSGGPPRARISTITLSRQVSYSDLDLASGPGVTVLVERVRQAAGDVCRELDRRYPRSVYVPITREEKCAKRAAEDGMMQVNAILSGLKEAGATGANLRRW